MGRGGRGAARFLFYACINHAEGDGVAGTLPYPLLPCPSIHLVPLRLTTNFSSRPTFFPPVRRLQRSLFTRFLHTFRPTHTSSLVSCHSMRALFQSSRKTNDTRRWHGSALNFVRARTLDPIVDRDAYFETKRRYTEIIGESIVWTGIRESYPRKNDFELRNSHAALMRLVSVFRFILSLFATTNHACTSRDGTWKRVLFALCRLCRVLRKRIEEETRIRLLYESAVFLYVHFPFFPLFLSVW